MRIEKIGGAGLPLDNDDPERGQKRFESARDLDRKKSSQERFRREAGISKEEFLKQTERARKLGFDALLQEETNKINPRTNNNLQ